MWLFLLRNFGIIINNFIFHLECKLIIMQFFKKKFMLQSQLFENIFSNIMNFISK